MKSKIKVGILITFVIVFASSILIGGYVFYTLKRLTDNGYEILENGNDEPIHINGHLDWINAKATGICTGNGTYSDPYVIEDLVIDANRERGILIGNSTVYFIIENCTVYNAGWNHGGWECPPGEFGAIALFNVSNARINNNTCLNNTHGIYLDNGFNNTIFGNVININSHGISLSGTYNIISGNSVSNSWNQGIEIFGSNNNISGNTLNNNGYGITLPDWFPCITNLKSNNSIIIGNTINNCYNAISIGEGGNYTISENIMTNHHWGIDLSNVNNSNILRNTIENSEEGMHIYNSHNNMFSENNLTFNKDCIVEMNCSGNVFKDNQCKYLNSIPGWHPFFIVLILTSIIIIKNRKLMKKIKEEIDI
ncbi:MAG: right-handed parallel beta-helix repeat-containing protein [Promethearchaeota archaeon]